MIENAALGASDQHRSTLIRNMAAAILQALEANAIEDRLKISDLFWRQLSANPLKSRVRQGYPP